MRYYLFILTLLPMLSIASINPTIEDFIADKELLSDYESTCKGVNPFNASSYPSACENWAKANQKIFLSKKKTTIFIAFSWSDYR